MSVARPAPDPAVELLGPWWTYDAPSLRIADRNHRYLSVWSAGDVGPSVLLVPGRGEDLRVWEPLLPVLTRSFVVHALDVPDRRDTAAVQDAVTTGLAAVGATSVVARTDAAVAVLAAARDVEVEHLVLWEPRAGDVTPRPGVRVVLGPADVEGVGAGLRAGFSPTSPAAGT